MANEWFFFSTRSEDADIILTENGYYAVDPEGTAPIAWKDKIVGYAKTLNFYQGSPPNGSETDWMVEEFSVNAEFVPINKDDHSTQEKKANFVVCKIYRVETEPEWDKQFE